MKCIRCGNQTTGSYRICHTCLDDWGEMRGAVFNALQEKHGKLSPTNHKFFIKETKRLERIWRKDRGQFSIEIDKL